MVDVVRQFKSFENPSEVVVEIKSNGGNKEEGEAIYDFFNDLEIPVTTKTGKAYSIAAKIFAAGDTRIIEDTDKALMIHFARAKKVEGTAEELEIIAAELREIENDFVEFYSEHLNIGEDTVRNLLDNETFVSGSEAVDLGFATQIETPSEIVAELGIEISNKNKMSNHKKDKGRNLLEIMAEFVGYEFTDDGKLQKKQPETVAELTLQDSNGTDVVFPNLESDGTPSVGDKATVDGTAIPDGSYIMPSLEDATVVFVDGAITEIIPKEEEEETEVEARFDNWKKKQTELVAETEGLEISTWSMRLVNDSFAVGDILKYYSWEDEEAIVATAEVKIPDGRTVVTDASGAIVVIKEADSEEQVLDTETEASFEELKEKMSTKLKTEIEAELKETHKAEIVAKNEEIKSLKAKLGSKEFVAEKRENVENKKEKGASRYLAAARNL